MLYYINPPHKIERKYKMKKILFLFCLAAVALTAAEKKVLTIGNSFTWSLKADLPAIAKAQGDKLTLVFANHGGCTIQRHWNYAKEEESNPEVKRYKYKSKPAKLRDILAAEKWDIVTIQQASPKSWVKGSFYPELDELVAYVKKHAPDAEIVFQQTWSYRSDSWILTRDKLSNTEMYQGAASAYRKLAESHGLRVIPMGDAVQIFRKNNPPPEFKYLDNKARAKYKWPDVPPQAGDVVGVNRWIKQGGRMVLYMDSVHLNERGEYLQAAVWFAFLYGRKTSEIKFVPLKVGDDDAVLLRKYAQEAVDNYKQVAK